MPPQWNETALKAANRVAAAISLRAAAVNCGGGSYQRGPAGSARQLT